MIDVKSLDELVGLLFSGYTGEELTYNQYVLRQDTIYRLVPQLGKLRNFVRLYEGKVLVEYISENVKHIQRLLPLLVRHVEDKYRDIHFVRQLFPDKAPLSQDDVLGHERNLYEMVTVTGLYPPMYEVFKHQGYNIKWSFYYYADAHGAKPYFFEMLDHELEKGVFTYRKSDHYDQDLGLSVPEYVADYFRGFERKVKLHRLLHDTDPAEADDYMP